MKRLFLLALAAGLLTGAAQAQPVPEEFSGLAPWGTDRLVWVSDAKADSASPRLGVARIQGESYQVEPVTVEWGDRPQSNDLEAVCPVPGSADDFYLCESGFYKGSYGRVLRVHLAPARERGWIATVVSELLPRPAPDSGSTPNPDQFEGMYAVRLPSGEIMLVFARRGSGEQPGGLVWGLDFEDGTFSPLGEQTLDLRSLLPGGRSASDLVLVPEGDGWKVLVSAARDPGNLGPFASLVVSVGRLHEESGEVPFVSTPPEVLYRCDGLKVEGLCPAPTDWKGARFCVGTDDETLGGVLRPLP